MLLPTASSGAAGMAVRMATPRLLVLGGTHTSCLRSPSTTPSQRSSYPRTVVYSAPKQVRFMSVTAVARGGSLHYKDAARSEISRPQEFVSSRPHEDWTLFHPVYTADELKAVEVVNRVPKTFSDKIARAMVRLLRVGFDVVTRYKHPAPERAGEVAKAKGKETLTLQEMREEKLIMTPEQWLMRILFLETVAGVPGMVGAMLRHFKSLRMEGRDGGWIHTLLAEAENERMHLLTFMKVRQPGWFFKLMAFGAQGIFANLFFVTYVLSPAAAHRFVGELEQEAVLTYTKAIKDLEDGRLPEWEKMDAPNIAKDYWRLKHDAKMIDVLYAVRADEATHRFVNHSLATAGPSSMNPFGLSEPDMHIKGSKAEFTKEESEAWGKQVADSVRSKRMEVEEKEGV